MSDETETTGPAEEPAAPARTPEEIRAEIEATREALGDTVEALAEKTDVKAQTSKRVAAAKASLREKKDDVVSKASEITPDTAAAGAQQFGTTVQDKPLPFVTAGAFAAGVAVGWLLGRR